MAGSFKNCTVWQRCANYTEEYTECMECRNAHYWFWGSAKDKSCQGCKYIEAETCCKVCLAFYDDKFEERKESMDKAKGKREEILEKAIAIDAERDAQYGGKERNFESIAKMWSCYLDVDITAEDVCVMQAMLKIQRIKTGVYHEDNYVDASNYLALAAEMGEKE